MKKVNLSKGVSLVKRSDRIVKRVTLFKPSDNKVNTAYSDLRCGMLALKKIYMGI